MDFSLTDDQRDIEQLTDQIMAAVLTRERRDELAETGCDFDPELWRKLGLAGLLALPVPERYGGAGRGIIDACLVIIGVGRHTAPVPVASQVAAAVTVSRWGSGQLNEDLLSDIASGDVIAVPALAEAAGTVPNRPACRALADGAGYRLVGRKSLVPAGMVADIFLVPANTAEGTALFVVRRDDPGVELAEQRSSGGFCAAQLSLTDVPVPVERRVGVPDGAPAEMLADLSLLGACAQQYGVTREAVAMTAEYAKSRKQFDRPIGSFQAVAHRLADGYIDVLGQELTLWKAAWRLDAGLPAQAALASAKFWAAEAGHRVAHTAVHVHGGVGVDLTGDAHRFYSMAKYLEFLYGGAHHHAAVLGRRMRDGEAFEDASPGTHV